MTERVFTPLGVAVVTVSDTRTQATDESGPLAVQLLSSAGHRVVDRRIVVDDRDRISATFRELVGRAEVQVVVATGGTGVTARDVTPEALSDVQSKEIVGFGELFRALSFEQIGASTIQSRACAGVCSAKLVFVLPGSKGAVRLALEKIVLPQLDSRTRPCNFAELLPRL